MASYISVLSGDNAVSTVGCFKASLANMSANSLPLIPTCEGIQAIDTALLKDFFMSDISLRISGLEWGLRLSSDCTTLSESENIAIFLNSPSIAQSLDSSRAFLMATSSAVNTESLSVSRSFTLIFISGMHTEQETRPSSSLDPSIQMCSLSE